MKYIIAILFGFLVGAYSHENNGYIVGGILAYLLVQLYELKAKIKQFENKTFKATDSLKATTLQPESTLDPNTEPVVDEEPELSVAAAINKAEVAVQTQSQIPEHSHDTLTSDAEVDKILNTIVEEEKTKFSNDEIIHKEKFKDFNSDDSKEPEAAFDHDIHEAGKSQPDYIDVALIKIKNLVVGYFTGGNSLVRTGMLVLFIGVAFLLKYVAERTVIPVEFRYIGISLGSFIMLFLGWKLRQKRPGFALSLEGGGIGLLYLTLFAAMRIHHLIDPKVVLLLLITIVILSAVIAIYENSMALAIIGMVGGFAAPILTSTGSGSHVQLFSYYLLLNLGVFAMAWFKSWRILNVIGFVATFGIGSLWGYKYYKPEFLFSVEPFLVAYFLLYTVIAVLFAIKQPPKLKGINDGTIIFGTPLVGFALQAALMKDSEYGLAYSALALGVFYVLFAFFIKRMNKSYMKDLIESFVALGIGFATLAIPLGFDGRVTSAMWVAEGSALVWVGVRQLRIFPRLSGYSLTVFGILAFFFENKSISNSIPWLNADFIGTFIITLATAFIGLYVRAHAKKLMQLESKWIPLTMVVTALSWWLYGGMHEIDKQYPNTTFVLLELFIIFTSTVLLFFSKKIKFTLLLYLSIFTALFFIPITVNALPALDSQNSIFFNQRFIGLIIFALFHLYLSWYWYSLKRQKLPTLNTYVSYLFLISGLCAWLFAFTSELMAYYPDEKFVLVELLLSLTAFGLLILARYLNLENFRRASIVLTLSMLLPLRFMPHSNALDMAIINISFMGLLLVALTHFVMAWYWQKDKTLPSSHWQVQVSNLLLTIAVAVWIALGIHELKIYLSHDLYLNGILLFMLLSFVSWLLLAFKLQWKSLHLLRYAYLPHLLIMAYFVLSSGNHFHDGFGMLFWLLAFVTNYWILRLYDNSKNYRIVYNDKFHVISVLLMSFVLIYEWCQLIEYGFNKPTIWYHAAAASGLLLVTCGLYMLRTFKKWPFNKQFQAYFRQSLLLLAVVLWLIVIVMNLSEPGQLSFIPYIPILNGIDISSLLFVLLMWRIFNSDSIALSTVIDKSTYKNSIIALFITAFLIINASMLRSFHFWYSIEYKWKIMISSFLVQSGFSILWALTAVILMVMSAYKKWRTIWLVGLGVMIVVVIKLFVVDMSASGTVERIVAFLSVGVLLSLVGYFSPLPPEENTQEEQKTTVEEQS